nr:MAG TPA: tail protein [Caudoviricetes sp.]
MANQHVNKVAVNGQTVLDLSGDTVYPGMLAKGITAHDKSGAQITGTLEVPATEERMVELSMPSGNQVILPTSGKVMSKVTVQKPATLLPENIKKDVVIGGVTGSLEAGDTSETWVIKSSAQGELVTTQIAFTSNGQKFASIGANYDGSRFVLYYDQDEIAGYDPGVEGEYVFYGEAYRKLTFDTPPTGALLTWLQSNTTKQASGVSVQPSKRVTITQNGTTTVTPDTGYDALGKVEVSADVASGGEVLNFFGGSKYYITEITPTSDTIQITITPDDTTILNSPKFLLVTQDIPAVRNAVQTRAIARAPSYNYYVSAAIAFSVGQVCTQCIAYIDPYSGVNAASYVYSDVNGGDAFDGSHDITISGGSMTFNTPGAERFFKGGQTYKVLLIG